MGEEREKETIESYPKTTNKDTDKPKEAAIKCEQSLAMEKFENNQDNNKHSQSDEDMQQNQPPVMKKLETDKSVQCNELVTQKLEKENGNSMPNGDENISHDQPCVV